MFCMLLHTYLIRECPVTSNQKTKMGDIQDQKGGMPKHNLDEGRKVYRNAKFLVSTVLSN